MKDDPVIETKANYFAMCLLMPADFVRREVEKMGGIDINDDKAMKALAKTFGVEPTLMAIRIGQLSPLHRRQ